MKRSARSIFPSRSIEVRGPAAHRGGRRRTSWHCFPSGRWPSCGFVLAPELFRLALPGLSNVVLSLVKQTALVAVISYEELLRATAIAAGSTHQPLFFYAVACLLYLALTAFVAVAFRRADAAANRGLRPS